MTCKKYSTLLFVVVLALVLTLALVACTEINNKQIVGVSFEDLTVDYDGNPHTITLTGKLPAGVSVSYTNNTATEAGVYSATATLYGKGYETVTLTAKLTIVPPDVDITGVTFEDKTVYYDGNPHSLTVTGELPEGCSVTYENNTATNVGEYTATATLSGKGYNTLVLTATLAIELADADVTGVVFEDLTVDFDGNEHCIEVTSALPEGVSVSYDKNTATNAGEYTVTATFSQADRKDVKLTAVLTINAVPHVVVNNAEQLLAALENGGLILLGDDVVLENDSFAAITKDTYLNGRGHSLTAVNYAKSDYRVLDVTGSECKNVTICNLSIVADVWVQWLRGINVYATEGLTLNIDNVDVKLCDYYAFNIIRTNVDLTVNVTESKFSAWAAVYNRASGVTFNANNCIFEGTNIHPSPNSSGNYFTTFIISEYVLLNGDEFISENLSANNRFTLTSCEIVSKVALDDNGELIDTRQRLVDLRSPYNNVLELNDCVLVPVYYENMIYCAYDSEYIPQDNRNDPDYVVNTNRIYIDGVDVTENADYVEKYLDQ